MTMEVIITIVYSVKRRISSVKYVMTFGFRFSLKN